MRRHDHPIATKVAWLFVVFFVLFPKGGIKIAGIPLTWGYLILGLSAVPLIVIRLVQFRPRFRMSVLLAAASLLPFQVLCWYSIRANGIRDWGSALSNLTGFFLVPFLFFFIYPSFLPLINHEVFARCLRFCILAAALWGIFLFFWRPLTGTLVEIPLLTVNLDDYGQIEATKHIDRGAFFKLISTYNNGNVYGVATLILYPMYMLLEPKLWKRNTLRVALILTLSRTVWIGLITEQLLSLGSLSRQLASRFPRVQLGSAAARVGTILTTVALVSIGLLFSVRSVAFFFDSSLGGRQGQLESFLHPTFLPSTPFTGFTEIVYASALHDFGVSGLLCILLIFLFPFVLIMIFPKIIDSPISRAAAKGLILYAILAGADGAINLIPVLVFYWFAYMVFLCGLPGERAQLSSVRAGAERRPAASVAGLSADTLPI